jgi:hypothetical protein
LSSACLDLFISSLTPLRFSCEEEEERGGSGFFLVVVADRGLFVTLLNLSISSFVNSTPSALFWVVDDDENSEAFALAAEDAEADDKSSVGLDLPNGLFEKG